MRRERPGPSFAPRVLAGALGLSLALACRTALPPPEQPGAADIYRGELAKGPKGDRNGEVRAGLEQAEFEAARREHTILAYRKYLSEFPAGRHAPEARQRLEGLRWTEADAAGTEAALAGFLADEPAGAHAAEAAERLTQVRLQAALGSGDAGRLRAWLAASPRAAGRDRALAALDEAQFAGLARLSGADRAAAARAYLVEHAEGRHRAEASREALAGEVAEAVALEDEARLQALRSTEVREQATAGLERVRFERAAAELDGEGLREIAGGGSATASDAKAILAALASERGPGGGRALEAAARQLFLPHAAGDSLPDELEERPAQLHAWARALDGRKLQALLAELRSRQALVAVEALAAGQALLAGLPAVEARARAEALLVALRPRAQSAALLVELSLLEEAAGRPGEALAQARAAVAREPALVAAWRAAELELRLGEPAVALLAAQALASQAQAATRVHADLARGVDGRPGDRVAQLELCAAGRAADEAARMLASEKLAIEPGASEARERAGRVAGWIAAALAEAERAAQTSPPPGQPTPLRTCAERASAIAADDRAAVAARVAAARALVGHPAAAAALERAKRRDPAEAVQAVLAGEAAHAEAAGLR